MSNQGRTVLVVLVFLAAALRAKGLLANTFHADEALFASWARQIAIWREPLLADQLVDKPPLLFYLQAAFYPLIGPEMLAARLPNFIASLLMVPMVAMVAWRLYRNKATMVLAAAFIVFSPMAIQFSSSGFIDPLMTCLVVSSLVAVAYSGKATEQKNSATDWKPAWAGMLFGLAVMSKYQAWLFLPLLVGLALILRWRRAQWIRWLVGLTPVLVMLLAWELARGNGLTPIENQWQSYGGLRLAWSWELWPRLEAWAYQWSFILSSPVLVMLLLLALPLIIALLIDQRDTAAALDRLFTLFVVAYSLLLWFIAVPVWDRYVLALLPFIGLLLARMVWRATSYAWFMVAPVAKLPPWTERLIILLPIVLLIFQAPGVVDAYQGELPIGAGPSADQGAAAISEVLSTEPYGTVLYDHWYSWQWRYHLFDDKVYVSWFPDPDALVEDLKVFNVDDNRRFIALPASGEALPVKRALKDSGFSLDPVASADGGNDGPGIDLYLVQLAR